MKYVKPDSSIPKVAHRRCEYCSTRTDTKLLYKIMDKWACLSCGNKEICTWNAMIAEASVGTASPDNPLDTSP